MKRAEQSIAASRDFAESVLDTVRESLLVLDPDLGVRSANRSFCRLVQLSPREVEGRRLPDIGAGQWADPALARALERVSGGGSIDSYRLEREFPGGGERVLLLNARRFDARGDGAALLLLAIEDVTEAVRSEAALREMLASAAEPILMSDAQGRIVFANPASHRVYRYEPGELLGQPIDGLVPEALRARLAKQRAAFVDDLVPRPMGRSGMELTGQRKDGTLFDAEVALTPMRGASGPIVVTFVSDISERKEHERRFLGYQERLRRVAVDAALSEERERRRIAANLHDSVGQILALVRNKLATAKTGLDCGARTTLDDCVGLLDEAVAETRTLTFDLSPPILYDLGLEPALRWLAEQMEQRYGMHVEIEGDADVRMDSEVAGVAFRAVRELLTNVSKHAGLSAAKVSLREEGDRLQVAVEDAGAGFSAAAEPRPEIGFGLFSVREQIERLGGWMTIHSAPGQGTRVILFVPPTRAQAQRAPEEVRR